MKTRQSRKTSIVRKAHTPTVKKKVTFAKPISNIGVNDNDIPIELLAQVTITIPFYAVPLIPDSREDRDYVPYASDYTSDSDDSI